MNEEKQQYNNLTLSAGNFLIERYVSEYKDGIPVWKARFCQDVYNISTPFTEEQATRYILRNMPHAETSEAFFRALEICDSTSEDNKVLLVTGEIGVGKTWVAQFITTLLNGVKNRAGSPTFTTGNSETKVTDPFYRVEIGPEGRPVMVLGKIAKALEQGKACIIDEFSRGSNNLSNLKTVMERLSEGDPNILTLNAGNSASGANSETFTINLHQNSILLCTANSNRLKASFTDASLSDILAQINIHVAPTSHLTFADNIAVNCMGISLPTLMLAIEDQQENGRDQQEITPQFLTEVTPQFLTEVTPQFLTEVLSKNDMSTEERELTSLQQKFIKDPKLSTEFFNKLADYIFELKYALNPPRCKELGIAHEEALDAIEHAPKLKEVSLHTVRGIVDKLKSGIYIEKDGIPEVKMSLTQECKAEILQERPLGDAMEIILREHLEKFRPYPKAFEFLNDILEKHLKTN